MMTLSIDYLTMVSLQHLLLLLLLLLITGTVYRLLICDRESFGFKTAQNSPQSFSTEIEMTFIVPHSGNNMPAMLCTAAQLAE